MVKWYQQSICTSEEIRNLIAERVATYIPEYTNANMEVRLNGKEKRLHKSVIYQFDVYDKKERKIVKSLVVKKRVFNEFYDNDIVQDTQQEFDALTFLSKLPGHKLRSLHVLDVIAESGILVTEKVAGKSLYRILSEYSCMPLTQRKKSYLCSIFMSIGEWLRTMHTAGDSSCCAKIDTAFCLEKAEIIAANFPQWRIPRMLGEKIVAKMRTLAPEAGQFSFGVSYKHGDFQPRNIICYERGVTVLDIGFKKRDIVIKDVCNFVVGIKTFGIKAGLITLGEDFQKELISLFLASYFAHDTIPWPAINFLTCLGVLEFFQAAYMRNRSLLKRNLIVSFYKRKIKEVSE